MAEGMQPNVLLLSVDEVRADHLSCYGYDRIETIQLDRIAQQGVLFERCIAAACITPVCMSSVICGAYPDKHTVRSPFCQIQAPTAAQVFKAHGYDTAGFVGQGLLGSKHGFAAGFDVYDEPTKDTSWGSWNAEEKEVFYEGYWWTDHMLDWLRSHNGAPFFVWGHYFETHEGAEQSLVRDGKIPEGELSEFSYKDAKIKYMDEQLVGPTLRLLEEKGLTENTVVVLMSDHGTNLGEHPARPVPHREYNLVYPQHTTLYDVDTRVALLMRGPGLPQNRRIPGVVRSVDIVPTLLSLAGVPLDGVDFDGQSLLPVVEAGEATDRRAYSEMLYPLVEGMGSLQAYRTNEFKFIRDLTNGTEEYYRMAEDPTEQHNLIETVRDAHKDELREIRRELNRHLFELHGQGAYLTGAERAQVEDRLRRLGYME